MIGGSRVDDSLLRFRQLNQKSSEVPNEDYLDQKVHINYQAIISKVRTIVFVTHV